MPEGLKNVGSTFSCLTRSILKDQIGRNIFTNVDDIIVASKRKADHMADLAETFANMREAKLRLNLEKCVFDIRRGRVLGYLVLRKGIEVNLDKIRAIAEMHPPQTVKEVQKLIDPIAALNRFILKSAEWSLPFIKVLRGARDFAWGPEQAAAFEDLKSYLADLTTLSSPTRGAELLLYLAASHHAVSAVLVQEKLSEGRLVQSPVYFVSEVLTESRTHMSEMERIAYAVVMASRKLRNYFEAHKIRVLTKRSLWDIYSKPEAFAQIWKWAMELSEYHLVASKSIRHSNSS
jgi:hypothetical protein